MINVNELKAEDLEVIETFYFADNTSRSAETKALKFRIDYDEEISEFEHAILNNELDADSLIAAQTDYDADDAYEIREVMKEYLESK